MAPAVPSSKKRPKRPLCRTCQKRIHIPQGWSIGAAVRRHYWRRHPEVMRGDR